ncbi:MAG: hypothetical protein LRY55_05100 [Leadbetterella sp.]|nr:hypothetical protein [Leadbetterella sp.]
MVSSVASKTTINKAEREASSGEIVIKEPYVKNLFEDGKFEIAHYTHFKAGRKDYFKAGFYFDYFMGNYVQDVYSSKIPGTPKYWRRGIDYSGRYTQSNVYLNYLRKITQNTELVAGLSYKYLSLTRKYVLEPKLSASIQTGDKGTLSLGTGLYSKAPSLIHVNTEHFVYDDKGNVVSSSRNNGNLGYMKSFHSVAGYDHYFSPRLHLKTEVYYQRLYDVITARTTSETEGLDNVYASLNEFSFSFDAIPAILANHGKGENYGLEMTLEHFMNDGFYFLATGSVYNSRYRAVDKTWRNTRFNANFVTNLLGGKEFHIKDNLKILADLKLNFMNGNRYIPLLEKETLAKEEAVYDYSRTYTRHLPHFFRADIRIGYKTIGKKITQEMAFEAQNITNRKNVYMQQYNPDTKSLETLYQNGITPMGLYRIYF